MALLNSHCLACVFVIAHVTLGFVWQCPEVQVCEGLSLEKTRIIGSAFDLSLLVHKGIPVSLT